MTKKTKLIGGETPSNGAESSIMLSTPTIIKFCIEGTSDLLFHKWNCEAVEAKAQAKKGSASKKIDDLETFVYRNEKDYLCIPGEYVRQAIIHAAKFKQDPRSSRKSAMDLYKAAIISLTNLSSLGIKNWDYEDKRRVVIQKSAISRIRPAIKAGWTAEFDFVINLPEYISKHDFIDVLSSAGKLIGLGDFRPTFGRFVVKKFE